jgi:hypothetical protein
MFLDKLNINNYSNKLELYNIITKYMPECDLIEPSIKFINNKPHYNRYTIPIFNINQPRIIKKIFNKIISLGYINIKYKVKILKKINKAAGARGAGNIDLILGIDNDKFKLYFDYGDNAKSDLICYVFENSYLIKKKYYNKIPMLCDTILYNINQELLLINKKWHLYDLILNKNNISHIYFVEPNEYHFILKYPLDFNTEACIYVIGFKNINEITLYIR